jgi:uncharacterized membrane protein/CheY-like chemotaxis protein
MPLGGVTHRSEEFDVVQFISKASFSIVPHRHTAFGPTIRYSEALISMQNLKILIVDDVKFNLELLRKILKGAGYTHVTSTLNPRDVCAIHKKTPQDLILLDIEMPGIDGFEVLRLLRLANPDDFPSVLVITGESHHKQRAIDAGAKDFISKPFEMLEVLTRVSNLLETRLLQKEILEHKDDNPALSKIIQKNIRKIIQIRSNAIHGQVLQDRIANGMTTFSGSMPFFYVHIVWFLVWIFINTGHLGVPIFDPFPYGLLTMIVSLEAIFLSTFVLISQNILSKETAKLSDLGLQTGLLTEHELTRVLQMLKGIQIQLGITNDAVTELADADLEKETRLEDILSEIDRLQLREDGCRNELK